MKIAVIADIHSNIYALEIALNIIENESPEKIFVCGDIVGYGKYPNECCESIRSLPNCSVIAGNHDYAVAGFIHYKETFSAEAISGIEYTKNIITSDNLKWVKSLPLHIEYDDMEFVHGSLICPEEFYYLINGNSFDVFQSVAENFQVMKSKVCFVGHTHDPIIFLEKSDGRIKNMVTAKYFLGKQRAMVDVGSIGKPRNSSRNASFVIFDNNTINFKRFRL